MSPQAVSLLLFAELLTADVIVPIGLVVLMVRQNFRYRTSDSREFGVWVATAAYLGLLALPAAILADVTIHPQPEGLTYLLFLAALVLFSLPGSAVSALVTWLLGSWLGQTAHPAGVGSFTLWLVAGTLAWGLFNAVGLRWLIQIRRRRWMRRASRIKAVVSQGRA